MKITHLRFIVPNVIVDTGTCSFRWQHEANMDPRWRGGPYGEILAFPRVDSRGQDAALYLFAAGRGQILTAPFLSTDPKDDALHALLRRDLVDIAPNIIILVSKPMFVKLEPSISAYSHFFISIKEHHGELRTG